MVLRQVSEHRHVVPGAVDPAERQRMAGHLHRGRRHAALHHDGEQRLQVRRLRRGQRRANPLRTDPDLHPADQPGLVPGRAQPGLGQVAGGRLAACPCHPDHRHPVRRVAVDPAGDVAEPVPRRGHHEHRHAGAGRPVPAGLVGEDGDRPGRDGLVAVGGAVGALAGQGRVQVTGPHLPGIEGDAGEPAWTVRNEIGSSHAKELGQPGQRTWRNAGGSDHAPRVSNIRAH